MGYMFIKMNIIESCYSKCVSAKPYRLLEKIAIEMAKYVQCGSAASVAEVIQFSVSSFGASFYSWRLGKSLRKFEDIFLMNFFYISNISVFLQVFLSFGFLM